MRYIKLSHFTHKKSDIMSELTELTGSTRGIHGQAHLHPNSHPPLPPGTLSGGPLSPSRKPLGERWTRGPDPPSRTLSPETLNLMDRVTQETAGADTSQRPLLTGQPTLFCHLDLGAVLNPVLPKCLLQHALGLWELLHFFHYLPWCLSLPEFISVATEQSMLLTCLPSIGPPSITSAPRTAQARRPAHGP